MNNNNISQFIQKRKIQRYIPIKVFSRTLLAQNDPFLKKTADYQTIADWLNPDKLANQTSVRRKVV